MTDDRLEEAHNKGQKDGSENCYDPPYDELHLMMASVSCREDMIAENEAYDLGYENGANNRDY